MTLRLVREEKVDSDEGMPRYEMIGEFHLDSIMNGEAVKENSRLFTTIHLI